jgi:hypothetical protein
VDWDELVATALIGTDRRTVETVAPPGSPEGLTEALAERGAEDRVLAAAAAWTVARRAGAKAAVATSVEPAEPDARPLCSAAAGARLRMMLDGEYRDLIPEWLARAARAGVRPLPELIPALLDHAVYEREQQDMVTAAAGPLGRWLAAREPRWGFVAGDTDDVWKDGGSAERRAFLRRLRRHDPDKARELLASTFKDETYEDREAFVAALAEGLSDADEPFLEAALDDGRRPVRAAAAELLKRLPRSRYAARMAERTKPLLHVEDGEIRVELPGPPDEAAKRDGIESGGRRAERLTALLAATPLDTWSIELAQLHVADDLGPFVREGWGQAARAQHDATWARALRRHDLELLQVLPRATAEELARQAPDPLLAAQVLHGQWGLELSKQVLEAIRERRKNLIRDVDVRFAGYRLDPSLEHEAESLRELPGIDIERLCDVLAFRAAMLRELG